jgi:hypothetical protein
MKKFLGLLVLPMLLPLAAEAGAKCSSPVFIDTVNRFARGAFGSARNSADGLQNLTCTSYSWGYVFCQARDVNNVNVSCGTSNAAFVNMVRAMESTAYVSFSWDAAGTCTDLIVGNSSCHEPKQP